jgi:hypothetical protein
MFTENCVLPDCMFVYIRLLASNWMDFWQNWYRKPELSTCKANLIVATTVYQCCKEIKKILLSLLSTPEPLIRFWWSVIQLICLKICEQIRSEWHWMISIVSKWGRKFFKIYQKLNFVSCWSISVANRSSICHLQCLNYLSYIDRI